MEQTNYNNHKFHNICKYQQTFARPDLDAPEGYVKCRWSPCMVTFTYTPPADIICVFDYGGAGQQRRFRDRDVLSSLMFIPFSAWLRTRAFDLKVLFNVHHSLVIYKDMQYVKVDQN